MMVSQRFAQGFFTILGWYKSWRYELEAVLALLGVAYLFIAGTAVAAFT